MTRSTWYIWKSYWVLLFPFTGFWAGKYIDDLETERMSMFRDKSAMYGRELKPGEPPTWPY